MAVYEASPIAALGSGEVEGRYDLGHDQPETAHDVIRTAVLWAAELIRAGDIKGAHHALYHGVEEAVKMERAKGMQMMVDAEIFASFPGKSQS